MVANMNEDDDTFASRIAGATEKEKADAARLEQKYGCKVYPFGQGQLPDEARAYLRQSPGPLYIRWLADLLIVRPDLQQQARQVNLYVDSAEGDKRARERNYANPTGLLPNDEWRWLGDSKTGRQDTSYWVLEKDAHTAHRLQQPGLGLRHVYLWPDGCSCSYVEDLPDEVLIDGPPMRVGSGTPYWLVPKELTRPLDEVFGKGILTACEPDEAHTRHEKFQRFLSGIKIHIAEDQWDGFRVWAESWYSSLKDPEDALRLIEFLGGIRHRNRPDYQDYKRLIQPYMDTNLCKDVLKGVWPFLETPLRDNMHTIDQLIPGWEFLDRKRSL